MARISRRRALQLLAATAAAPLATRAGAAEAVREAAPAALARLPPAAVEIGGLLGRRITVNVEQRLLRIDEQKILSCFAGRESAGGPDRAWIGEHAGKFLDAACLALRHRAHPELRRLADRVAAGLVASQAADGYLGTYPDRRRWSGWDVWVHKYNLIGLLSYHELSADPAALAACERMFELLAATFGGAPGQRDIVAAGEHMGMAATSVLEPVCRLYRVGGDPRVLEFARYLVRAGEAPHGPRLVSSLLAHGSVYRTANGKAYEMLSNLVGLLDLYRLTAEDSLRRAVLAAWDDIRRHQLYPTGTVSAAEHFQPPPRLLGYPASNVGETCATVTWLQLNAQLFRLSGEARFGAEIERTVYNHLLAAQDERSGDICYYTALSGRKEYSHHLVCCVSSGPRGLALLPELAWALAADAIVVNLYAPGRASFVLDGAAVEVASTTRFPLDGEVTLRVVPQRALRFTIRLRVPEWATAFEAATGTRTLHGTAGTFLDVTRTWERGSELRIRMDLPLVAIAAAPTYPALQALKRGPQVLALEQSLNRAVPYLHRAVLPGRARPAAVALAPPQVAPGGQAYRLRGRAGVPASGGLRYEPRDLVFVPFADARDFRVLVLRAQALRRDRPPLTAYARAWLSTAPWLAAGGEAHAATDVPEALTDEDPQSFCIVDPRDPNLAMLAGGPPGHAGDPVSFTVSLDAPALVSRIVFRHGPLTAAGGWFDTSTSRPRLELARTPLPTWRDAPYPEPSRARWDEAAELPGYPSADATTPPRLAAGQPFVVTLTEPQLIYGLRIVGRAGGDFVSCAELSAFAG